MIWEFRSTEEIDATGLRRDLMRQIERISTAESDLPAAELICGELIGNVIRHAPGPVTLTLACGAEFPTLTVCDHGPAFAVVADLPEDPLAERGRGLFIVRCLARSLQMDSAGSDEMVVRVELPVTCSEGGRF